MYFSSFTQDKGLQEMQLAAAPLLRKLKGPVQKKKILVIAGPTAVGKTAISLRLAEMLGGEIISADSMQVYRGMNIGTAKPSLAERQKIPHHLIDICNVNEPFNVAQFYREGHHALKTVLQRGAVPIVVGGTGFYLRAFIYGPPSGPPSVPHVRQTIENQLDELGPSVLYERLKNFDPEYAARITVCDRHKIVRALEIIAITGLKVTEFTASSPEMTEKYHFHCFFIYRPLEELYKKIEERCETMMREGLLDEVKALIPCGLCTNNSAAQAIGYRQCLHYFNSPQTEQDLAFCVA